VLHAAYKMRLRRKLLQNYQIPCKKVIFTSEFECEIDILDIFRIQRARGRRKIANNCLLFKSVYLLIYVELF
jgi:hypothetical protein